MQIDQRRRLTELYARGEVVTLEEASEDQEALTVWVRKLTPTDAEVSYMKANARRASVLAMAKEEVPSDLYLSVQSEIGQLDHESMIAWVASQLTSERAPLIRAELGAAEEWSEEKYLESLQERATEESFQEKEKDDPEVVRVLEELTRFQAQVTAEIDVVYKEIESNLEQETDNDLRERIMKTTLSNMADAAWLTEFQACQVWRSVFWDDHKTRVFPERSDVDEIQGELALKLREAIDRIHVGDMEGKD